MTTPKTNRNTKELMGKVQSLRTDIDSLMTGIRTAIDTDLAQACEGAIDWGLVGSLEHIRGRMQEILEFCAGVDPNEG